MNKILKPKVLVILGPTATGKSDIAVKIAKKFNGEIIGADSRQVYKGMDLGSGKITRGEMRGVPHHLLDAVSPQTRFSAARYKKLAEKAIKKILAKNKLPIIVGGTGFYIDALAKNIELPDVPPNAALRKRLAKKSAPELFALLRKLFPSRGNTIDRHNPVRLIRAIEIAKALGHVPKAKEKPAAYEFLFIGLDLPDAALKAKIEKRLISRIEKGMIGEIGKLHKSGVSWKRLESFGLEYRETARFLEGKISRARLVENLKNDIWHFAKRQRTWFKRNKRIRWFRPKETAAISRFLKEKYML